MVIAGDLLEVASVVPQDAQIVVVTEYLRRLSEITRVFVCSGNHDLDVEGPGGERIAGWLAGLGVAAVVRDGQAVVIGEMLFSCFPWWEGAETRTAIAAQMARDAARRSVTPAGVWVWIHHAPPRDSPVSWGGSRSYGDQELSDWIAEFSPTLVLSGHVHQAPFVAGGRWVDRIGDTWVFNMGQQIGEAPDPRHHRHRGRRRRLVLAGGERVDRAARRGSRAGTDHRAAGLAQSRGSEPVLGGGAVDPWRCIRVSRMRSIIAKWFFWSANWVLTSAR